MMRLVLAAPDGEKVIVGYTAEDHSKTVFGKVLTIDTSDLRNVIEIAFVYRATKSELTRAFEQLIGPDTKLLHGVHPDDRPPADPNE